MILHSPSSYPGEGATRNPDLRELSPPELIARIKELEEKLDKERRRTIEVRRGRESGEGASPLAHVPTHLHEDGYDVVSNQRVAILVDVQNMYYAARNLYNSKLEFSKLLHFLCRGRVLARAIAYIVERPGMEQEKFVEVLRRNGYEVRKKLLIERSDGSQKGDWDLGMALDAISLSDKVDGVILVTGDGDFVTLVHYLHCRGVRVEVASFPDTTALELIRSCNYYHRLNDRVLLPTKQFGPIDTVESGGPGEERGRGAGESGERPERGERGERGDRLGPSAGRGHSTSQTGQDEDNFAL